MADPRSPEPPVTSATRPASSIGPPSSRKLHAGRALGALRALDTIAPRQAPAVIAFQSPLPGGYWLHMSKGFGESDFAQVQAERANTQTIRQVLERDREQAEHARDRQAQGAHGICEDCGRKIGDERLE